MKVLQVAKFYPPSKGGMETVVKNLCDGLNALGIKSDVLCYSENSASTEILDGIQVTRAKNHGVLFSQPLSIELLHKTWQAFEHYDLIHVHSPNPIIEAALCFKKTTKPLVVSYHADVVRQKLLIPFYKPFLSAFLRKADSIVCSSGNLIESSIFLKDFKSKCHVIPFGINDPRPGVDQNKLEQIRKNYGKFLLFVGRLVSYKGVETLVDAAKQIEYNIVLIGDGPLHTQLQQKISELGLSNKVQLLGKIQSEKELYAFYSACHAFVLPSVHPSEAFGMVLLEAMAFGKPLITSRLNTGVTFVNSEGETGLCFEPGNAPQLATAVQSLFSDTAKYSNFSAAARARFEKLFLREKMATAYASLYENSMKRDLQKNAATA